MDELTIGDKMYISSKRAAKITGYAKDYVGQLCREGRVEARLVGRNWYVLESSIREHRFGEENSKNQNAVTDASAQPAATLSESDSSWSAPRYEAETPEMVPPLIQRPEPVAARKVVSDMQNAWQEWFTTQKSPTETLPDDSQEFDESSLTAPAEEPEEAQEEAVHITKIETESPQQYTQEESSFDVPLHKLEQHIQPREQATRVSSEESEVHRKEREPEHSNSTPLVLKSILLGVAMLAVVIALVGTGVLADLLKESGKTENTNSMLKFLGGQSEFYNN